jgi:hypothetical protein
MSFCHDALPHHGPETMEQAHGLNHEPKQIFPAFKLLLSGICYTDKKANTNDVGIEWFNSLEISN